VIRAIPDAEIVGRRGYDDADGAFGESGKNVEAVTEKKTEDRPPFTEGRMRGVPLQEALAIMATGSRAPNRAVPMVWLRRWPWSVQDDPFSST
jgi:hypothetical protein